MKRLARLAPVALYSVAFLAPGCGGDDDDGGGDEKRTPSAALTERPTPKQPITAEIAPFSRAISTQDCKKYYPLVLSFSRGERTGTPATEAECKGRDPEVALLRGYRVELAAQYGTAGILDGPAGSGNKRRHTIWTLDGDGRFRYTQVTGTGTAAQAGTPFSDRKEARRLAEDFLAAVRERDCAAMARLFSPEGSRLVVNTGSTKAACRAVLEGEFLAPAVRKTPNPRIEVLGGTRNLAFVGVATKDIYFTMTMGDGGKPKLRLFDVVPSSPVKLPNR